ncbi:MAG: hypothetical protein AB8B64_17805 [Granulosicoccus sp.]
MINVYNVVALRSLIARLTEIICAQWFGWRPLATFCHQTRASLDFSG